MKRFVFLGVLLVAGVAHAAGDVDESVEPLASYTLLVDGKPFTVSVDEKVTLHGSFVDPRVELRVGKTRTFPYAGLRFQYPAHFTWEADLDGGRFRNWTLSGNDFKIMLFVTAEDLVPANYVTQLRSKFGRDRTSASDRTQRLGERVFEGKRLVADVAGYRFRQDVYALPPVPKGGGWRLIVLQAPVDPEGGAKKEVDEALRLLEQTFAVVR